MRFLSKAMKRDIRKIFNALGYEIKPLKEAHEGFPSYLQQANKAGMDVNDWIENKLGWGQTLPMLEDNIYAYLGENYVVCEIGPGTGRWSRHLADKLGRGQLRLIDTSWWLVNFLKRYFAAKPNVTVYCGNGYSMPFIEDASVDVVFSEGTFIDLNLSIINLYAKDAFRVLRRGGRIIFDYIDISTQSGWAYLQAHSTYDELIFHYHTGETIDKVLRNAGFEIERHFPSGEDFVWVVARKP